MENVKGLLGLVFFETRFLFSILLDFSTFGKRLALA